MNDRMRLALDFLGDTDWAGAMVTLLAGDASNRKYFRLTRTGQTETAVLMDAPPEKGEDTRPFVRIARHLTSLGFSAPAILAADDTAGFLLLEDLGDALFARVLEDQPALETSLYTAATDALVSLHAHAPPHDLAPYDCALMADMAALAFDWYATTLGVTPTGLRDRFHTAMHDSLAQYCSAADVLIQRDYHAENLLWLPDRTGIARVGLLDFQDAMKGHRAYDLVSLLQDARRDVPPTVETEMIRHYITATGVTAAEFDVAYHCLGVQRNLRILGVFARLCVRDGKKSYVDLIPRVWDHLQRDVSHPALANINDLLIGALPAPTAENLKALKDKCATLQTQ